MTRPGLTLEERFWMKVDKSGECWNWTGAKKETGYGQFSISPSLAPRAHRFSYELVNGEIPAGKIIDHICRNRLCVRPDHLRLATYGENSQHQDGHRDSRSGARGVYWHKGLRRWRVAAVVAGIQYHGGYFSNIEEASAAARQLRNNIMTHNTLDRMGS